MAIPPDRWPAPRRPPDNRHQRTAITLLLLAVFVSLAGWIAWSSLTDPSDAGEADSAAPTCLPAPTTTPPAPADIRLNVYNSTDRNGLASSTAGAMRERGFAVLDIANDPLGREITGTAEVRAGLDNQAAASVVVAQVAGAVFVPDDRTDDTIDLVVGVAFEALAPAGATPVPVPNPTGTAAALPPC
ncbi:MAG: LytR C-terminal domain-containing protein [Jiangellaceae bacterium]